MGWVVVGSFLAPGVAGRPLVLIFSGLLFSVLTAWLLSHMSPKQAESTRLGLAALPEGHLFAHPPALRRWIRLGLIIWPVGIGGSSLAYRANLVSRPLLITSLIVYGFFFILTLYVLRRTLTEVRVSDAGLDVRLPMGRRVSISWGDIVTLQSARGLSRGSRLVARSGFSLFLDNSLPGYASLIALIQLHLDARQQGSR